MRIRWAIGKIFRMQPEEAMIFNCTGQRGTDLRPAPRLSWIMMMYRVQVNLPTHTQHKQSASSAHPGKPSRDDHHNEEQSTRRVNR